MCSQHCSHASGVRRSARGMTLIELVIGVAILGVLLAMAAPAFSDWMRNAKVRSTAESLQSGLQLARAEAVRRNSPVRFQLTTTIDNGCALSVNGPNWVVNQTSSTTPIGACATAPSDTVAPLMIQTSPVVATAANVTVVGSREVVAFDGLGRQTGTTNPNSAAATLTINVGSSAGTCMASGGNVRCLRVVLTPGGESRLCDPARTASNDSMKCP